MSLPLPIKAIIFDLDGTLADTFPLIVASWNAAMREPLGRDFTPDEVVARFGIPDSAMLRRELQELPEPVWKQANEAYHAHYEAYHDIVTPFEGVPAMLRALHELGLPMGVMTGKGRRTADITLHILGWMEFFGSVVTGDEVENQKPSPDGILLVAQELGVAPQHCVYIGDAPSDIEAGKAAGMLTIAAAWHSYYGERLRDSNPDYWAATPADVQKLITERG
ncbi:MAG: HAD family hydrolase [Abitibacteriaceae bacterium]|nr:HAD family hydrolase [Abditibacteriaceae bacterium]MBV9866417.1 HAD family hydrolase [Abditibacteriaceae bacterium]